MKKLLIICLTIIVCFVSVYLYTDYRNSFTEVVDTLLNSITTSNSAARGRRTIEKIDSPRYLQICGNSKIVTNNNSASTVFFFSAREFHVNGIRPSKYAGDVNNIVSPFYPRFKQRYSTIENLTGINHYAVGTISTVFAIDTNSCMSILFRDQSSITVYSRYDMPARRFINYDSIVIDKYSVLTTNDQKEITVLFESEVNFSINGINAEKKGEGKYVLKLLDSKFVFKNTYEVIVHLPKTSDITVR